MDKVKKQRKAVLFKDECVACGCCAKVCPRAAIEIVKGIYAQIDLNKCVGCGKCVRECPASIISIAEVSA